MNSPPHRDRFRVLVVDDLSAIHDDFRKILAPAAVPVALHEAAAALFGPASAATPLVDFALDSALQGEEALRIVERALAADQPFALAFVDMRMPPGWDGLETIRHLWAADPALQVVLCTAYSDYSWTETVTALGHTANLIILKKPFDNTEVLQLAHALTQKWQLARDNLARLALLDELVQVRTRELQQAEERFAKAFDASPLPKAIIALDNMEVLEINAALEQTLQVERAQAVGPAAGMAARGLDPILWRPLFERLAANEPVDDFPFVYRPTPSLHRDLRCSSRPITIDGRPCAICVLRDVTEQLELQQQFLQAQKMEAVGQLAAGVAHDFNNLLTVIQSYSGFVRDDTKLSKDHRESLEHVRAAAERAAGLTRQLLAFSRRQITQPALLDVAGVLGNFRKMLARLVPERIALEFDCAPNLPPIIADVANLEHVIMNLVVNARDALPHSGRITVAASAVTLDDTSIQRHPDRRPGRFVRLSIADTGTGIDPKFLARIFEPFFTTKEVGQGTGLGLSTAYGIVHQHEGWIEVASAIGRGTTFTIYFPVAKSVASDSLGSPSAASPAPETLRGRGERILLVEDDPAVRLVARAVVTRAGYHVTEAVDGPSALTAWEAAERRFDLLLTDVIMPNGYTGIELAQRLRQDAPSLKVILTTGYSDELLKRNPTPLGDVPILLKPYEIESILRCIRSALDAPAVPAPVMADL